jgi:hypothetical protein
MPITGGIKIKTQMSNRLPAFSLESYITLLNDLAAVGYQFDRAGDLEERI